MASRCMVALILLVSCPSPNPSPLSLPEIVDRRPPASRLTLAPAGEGAVVRRQTVSLGSVILENKADPRGLTFRIFGVSMIGRVEEGDQLRALSGLLEQPKGSFTLTYRDGKPSLNVHVGDRMYEVRPSDSGETLIVTEIDLTKISMECQTDGSPHAAAARRDYHLASLQSGGAGSACSVRPDGAPVTIEVMVLYTKAARIGAAGRAAIVGSIDNNIEETNTTFVRSNIAARAKLAEAPIPREEEVPRRPGLPQKPLMVDCIFEVDYAESGLPTDLSNLMGRFDGALDEVHAARDYCKADIVTLIVETAVGGGMTAPPSTALRASDEKNAFTVVKRTSASGNYIFTHEIGHILGAGHDDGKGDGMCDDSHGWHFTSAGTLRKSMMAYSPGEKSLNFSDPAIPYDGVGPPTGHVTANNARAVRIRKQLVSRYR